MVVVVGGRGVVRVMLLQCGVREGRAGSCGLPWVWYGHCNHAD